MLLFMEAIPLCYLLNKLKPSRCVTEQTEAIPLCYWTNWSHPAVLLTEQTTLTL